MREGGLPSQELHSEYHRRQPQSDLGYWQTSLLGLAKLAPAQPSKGTLQKSREIVTGRVKVDNNILVRVHYDVMKGCSNNLLQGSTVFGFWFRSVDNFHLKDQRRAYLDGKTSLCKQEFNKRVSGPVVVGVLDRTLFTNTIAVGSEEENSREGCC